MPKVCSAETIVLGVSFPIEPKGQWLLFVVPGGLRRVGLATVAGGMIGCSFVFVSGFLLTSFSRLMLIRHSTLERSKEVLTKVAVV